MVKTKQENMKEKYEGKEFESNNFGKFKVIKYINYNNVLVEFLKTKYNTTTKMSHIKNGDVKDKLFPNVYGIGYIGGEKYSQTKNAKLYKIWSSMLERVYSPKSIKTRPTYKNVNVCKEWFNFQVFAKWCEFYYIEGYQLDKDLLQYGVENKIYSPETCVFLPHKINSFMANNQSNNTSGFTGVSFNNKKNMYAVKIRDFATGKRIYLGYFKDKEKGFISYKNKRAEQVELAKEYMRQLGYWSEDVINKLR